MSFAHFSIISEFNHAIQPIVRAVMKLPSTPKLLLSTALAIAVFIFISYIAYTTVVRVATGRFCLRQHVERAERLKAIWRSLDAVKKEIGRYPLDYIEWELWDPTYRELLNTPEWSASAYEIQFPILRSFDSNSSIVTVVVADPGWCATKSLPLFVRMSSDQWSRSCGPALLSDGSITLSQYAITDND